MKSKPTFTREGVGTGGKIEDPLSNRFMEWLGSNWFAVVLIIGIALGFFYARSLVNSEKQARAKVEAANVTLTQEKLVLTQNSAAKDVQIGVLKGELKKMQDDETARVQAAAKLQEEIRSGVMKNVSYKKELLSRVKADPLKHGYKEALTDRTKKTPKFKRWAEKKAQDIVVRAGLVFKIRKEFVGHLSLVDDVERLLIYPLKADAGEGIAEPLAVFNLASDVKSAKPRKAPLFFEEPFRPPKKMADIDEEFSDKELCADVKDLSNTDGLCDKFKKQVTIEKQ
jgi:hypothetical protein